MRIYIADLNEYNNGKTKGEWVELDGTIKIWDEIKRITGDNEWSIHDYELPFKISENPDIDELQQLSEEWDDLSESDRAIVSYMIDDCGESIGDALDKYNNITAYECDSIEDLAEQFVSDGLYGEIPVSLQYYIDYEKIANDLSSDYTEYKYEGTTYFMSSY